MAIDIQLTPELEHFARQCVAEGRYNNVSEVVRSALCLLKHFEEQRCAFTESLIEAEKEADRDGTYTLEEALAEMDRIIDEAVR